MFVELLTGDHVRVPYADLSRQPVTLWEHREATQRLRREGRRTVDEHAIFTAVAEQRRLMLEAQERSKSARRVVARIDEVACATTAPRSKGEGQGMEADENATVPMPRDGGPSGVEFW